MKYAIIPLLAAVLLAGCVSRRYYAPSDARGAESGALARMGDTMAEERAEAADQSRMRIWRASLTIEVDDVGNAVSRIVEIAETSGGYVESRSDSGEERANLVLRVPSKTLSPTIDTLADIGEVTNRWISSEDVTEQVVDFDARLKNMVDLRDRLRALLEKAEDVENILAIERELGRLQMEIDALQARLTSLRGRVDMASVTVVVRAAKGKRILGPLGLLIKGISWTAEKLFVIRE